MSEFLMLGWNVAIPEVDVGDDIFVVQDENRTLRRVQVKTSTSTNRQSGFSGQFNVSVRNLRNITPIYIHYVFIVRHHDEWTKPVIIRQDFLLDHFESNHVGSEANGNVGFYFTYTHGSVECAGQDFTKYVRDFTDFPQLHH